MQGLNPTEPMTGKEFSEGRGTLCERMCVRVFFEVHVFHKIFSHPVARSGGQSEPRQLLQRFLFESSLNFCFAGMLNVNHHS